MELSEAQRQKLNAEKSWQWAKHFKLYSDPPLQAEEKERYETALDLQRREQY